MYAEQSYPMDRNGGKILIVEDEQISRRALSCLLRSCGFHTKAVGSAEEAIEALDDGCTPEVALVDVDLPGMSGLEFVKRMERSRPDTYTVLITAVEGERIRSFCRDHPVGYMRKPLDFERLLAMLTSAQQPH